MSDYLLGTAEKVFKDTEVLYQELKENIEKPVEFYVYNSDRDEVRVILLMPTTDWGGEGILGANVAYGFLHGLPSSCCQTIGMANEESTHRVINSPFGFNSSSPGMNQDYTDMLVPTTIPGGSPSNKPSSSAPPLPPGVATGIATSSGVPPSPPPLVNASPALVVHNIQLQAS